MSRENRFEYGTNDIECTPRPKSKAKPSVRAKTRFTAHVAKKRAAKTSRPLTQQRVIAQRQPSMASTRRRLLELSRRPQLPPRQPMRLTRYALRPVDCESVGLNKLVTWTGSQESRRFIADYLECSRLSLRRNAGAVAEMRPALRAKTDRVAEVVEYHYTRLLAPRHARHAAERRDRHTVQPR